MATLATSRRRAREAKIAQAVRDLPREVKREIVNEMDARAPGLSDLMRDFQATPFRFRVRDGNGWRWVLSPEIALSYAVGKEL